MSSGQERSIQKVCTSPEILLCKLRRKGAIVSGSIATPGDAARTINRPLQLILSVGTALLLLLFSAAFLSQTRRFPETNFESFSFWGMVVLGYMLVLWRIWR